MQTPSMATVTPLCNSNQGEKSSRPNTVYYNQPCEMQHKISWSTVRRCDGYSPQPALNKGLCLMTLCASFLAEAIPNFRLLRKYLPPRPLLLTKSHISLVSAFLSKLKRSLLACSVASSPGTLLHAARPRLSRKVIHTRPPSSSSFHFPHAPTASATPSTQITDPSTK